MTRTAPSADPLLGDAVERVRELSLRLWAVREQHAPVRGLLGRLRCGCCGEPHPCRTARVAAGAAARDDAEDTRTLRKAG